MPSGVDANPRALRGEGAEPDGESLVQVLSAGLKRYKSSKTAAQIVNSCAGRGTSQQARPQRTHSAELGPGPGCATPAALVGHQPTWAPKVAHTPAHTKAKVLLPALPN